MNKAELREQIEAMTEEEAAAVKLVYAADWPDEMTLIQNDPDVLSAVESGIAELERGETITLDELRSELAAKRRTAN